MITPHIVVYQGSSDTIPYLYAGTENDVTGAQLWRIPYSSSNTADWMQVMDFAAVDTAIKIVTYLYVWKGTIYFGTAGSGGGKGQWWQSTNGVNFTKNTGVGNGFGDMGNYAITSVADFKDQLYVTTRHQTAGGEVWRTADGASWEQVTNDAFGEGDDVDELHNIRVSFGKVWITGLSSTSSTSGYPVWHSEDGINFIQSNASGFGDANNKGNAPVTIGFGNYQYCGGNNSVTGAQIWRTCALLPVANFSKNSNGLEVSFTDSSSDATFWNWDFGDGDTSTTQNPTHTYLSAGKYKACLIALNLCGNDTICDSLTVSDPVAIENEFLLPGNMIVYPNPFKTTATIFINDKRLTSSLEVKMYDVFGREIIITSEIGNKEIKITKHDINSGLYFIQLVKEDKIIASRSIIVE